MKLVTLLVYISTPRNKDLVSQSEQDTESSDDDDSCNKELPRKELKTSGQEKEET